jgi:hypothetical protein
MPLDLKDKALDFDVLWDQATDNAECDLDLNLLDENEQEEFESLRKLASEVCNIAVADVDKYDFDHATNNVEVVREDEFEDYARDWANGIETIPDHWPYDHIDWKAAAEALKADWREFEYDGYTYLIRDI